MMGENTYYSVFQEVGILLYSENISLTKDDIDNMYPYERQSYIDLFKNFAKKEKDNVPSPDDSDNSANPSPDSE